MTNDQISEAVARKLRTYKITQNPHGLTETYPDYSQSIAAAWEIVEFVEKIEGSSFRFTGFKEQTAAHELEGPDAVYESGKFEASFAIYSPACDKCDRWNHTYYVAFADTAPLAICKAFLKLDKD